MVNSTDRDSMEQHISSSSNVLSFSSKGDNSKKFYWILSSVLIVGVVSLVLFTLKSFIFESGTTKKATAPASQNFSGKEIFGDNFAGSTLDDKIWSLQLQDNRSRAIVDSGKLVLTIDKPTVDEVEQTPSSALITSKKTVSGDFEMLAKVVAHDLYSGNSFRLGLQKDEDINSNFIGLVFERTYAGIWVRAVREIEEKEDLGGKLYEDTEVFDIKIVRSNGATVFYINDKHLGETAKSFLGDSSYVSLLLNSHVPAVWNAKVSVENLKVVAN